MSTRHTRNRKQRALAAKADDAADAVAISQLPLPLRWIVILGERDGLSPSEIARLAGISIETVQAMLRQGLALVRDTRLPLIDRTS